MGLVDALRSLLSSPAFKFIVIIVLILALAVPLLFVYFMVKERESYAGLAHREVGRSWGGEQTIKGPFIVVPTLRKRTIQNRGETRTETIREFGIFLPEELKIVPVVRSEERARGIFTVPVYRSEIAFEGRFSASETRRIEGADIEILWPEAVLSLLITDVRGIKKTAEITFGENTRKRFRAGSGVDQNTRHRPAGAIHVPLEESQAKEGFRFAFKLDLNGSSAIRFVPAGGETEIRAQSDWPHPSFSGAFLPDARTISDKGFEAVWKIPRLARGQGQTLHLPNFTNLMSHVTFGVDFYQPVKFYSLAERALKYAQGFIAIVFFAVFVMEMQVTRRVHWIQYLFVGLALTVFYLVLIGTAEHIGFEWGYLSAAAATSLLIATYIGTVTGAPAKGLQIFVMIAVIYGLLYLLLRVEDYALLIGSIAAFAMLAAVMFATRNIDWSRGRAEAVE